MGQREPTVGRSALAGAYARLAAQYWLEIFPCARRQMHGWRERAQQIPNPTLGALALQAQLADDRNVEGATAYAALAPRRSRPTVVCAQVAFQTLSHYLDTLAEQPSEDPVANGRQLNRALLTALKRDAPSVDYYAHHSSDDDGGYIDELVQVCRRALGALPSYGHVAAAVGTRAQYAVQFQSLNLPESRGGHYQLERWVRSLTASAGRLYWWETGAAADSTLGILALIGLAAQPRLTTEESVAVMRAYWPSVEALSTLLDSMVDESEDAAAGQRSFLAYYDSPQDAAGRMSLIAAEARRGIDTLPNAPTHAAILLGMAASYIDLAPPTPTGALISSAVLEALGFLAKPSVRLFRTRRVLTDLGSAGLSISTRRGTARRLSDGLAVQSHGDDRA